MNPMAIELKNLSVTYTGGGRTTLAVRNCSFSVARGDIVGLVGESGSGKSSALMAIPHLLPAGTLVSGEILCDGENLAALDERGMGAWRWRRIALVPQGAMNSFTPHLTIGRHITEVLEHHLRLDRGTARGRAVELLDTVGLGEEAFFRYPHELSGGQKQRAALAAALACGPDFLLADEPTTALDVITQKEVLDMTASLVRKSGMGLLLVTHDLPLAAGICDSLVVMKDGAAVESGPSRQVAANPKNAYTGLLIDSIRDMERPRDETATRGS
ncbi:MAG: ABC transporter ATP-binding protein [Synergistaceae bacterium]|jgi:ABC-type glutathione transport system ATPase component|nr:ABC transporter ATP-binding protein [Synergistaceae bacterium]